jgi:hypothetical protein
LTSFIILNICNYVSKTQDPRTRGLPLINDSILPIVGLLLFYYAFVFIGKRVMKNRKEFNVPTWFLFSYNFALVLLSLYMFEEIIAGVYQSKYDLMCAKFSKSESKSELKVFFFNLVSSLKKQTYELYSKSSKVTYALWLYFFSKAIEFMDTFLMIVRKKFNQITFLHVFHHSSMLVIWWIAVTWIPSGQIWLGAWLNSGVHVVMYLYYALSVIPSLKNKLWWKKYITNMQLVKKCFIFFFLLIFQGTPFLDLSRFK